MSRQGCFGARVSILLLETNASLAGRHIPFKFAVEWAECGNESAKRRTPTRARSKRRPSEKLGFLTPKGWFLGTYA